MANLTVKHEGGLASSINVRGFQVMVDTPAQFFGDNRGPMPSELLTGALGSCIIFFIGRWCQRAGLPYEGVRVEIEYVLSIEQNCVPVIKVEIFMPENFPAERNEEMLQAARRCTMHNTLCNPPQIEFRVGG